MKTELFDNKANAELVTADDFIKFISEFKSPIICPVCKQIKWTIFGPIEMDLGSEHGNKQIIMEGLTYTKYDQEADKSQNYPGGIPVFRMICDTCCNMMLFSYKHVRNAIMDKKEPKGDDENVSTKP